MECFSKEGIVLSDLQVRQLNRFYEMLVEKNKVMNLTGITEYEDVVIKHFLDSCMLKKAEDAGDISLENDGNGVKMIDVGTGAGFPGVPLLIAGPSLQVTLFDAVNKKLDFLRFLLHELDLQANVVHIRAEEAGRLPEYREKFDFVTARAVAQLRVLSEYCLPLVRVGGSFLSMKGSISEEEKTNGLAAFQKLGSHVYDDIFYNIHNGDERNLIIAKKVSHVSSKYPRNMGQIAKKPL